MALAQFPRNPRRGRQELRWAVEHQAIVRKHLVSLNAISQKSLVDLDRMRAVTPWMDGVKSQSSMSLKLERKGRSAMEDPWGRAIDTGQCM